MSKLVKRLVVLGLSILTVATVAMGFISFARKVDSFSVTGFAARREEGALLVTSVEPGQRRGPGRPHRGRPHPARRRTDGAASLERPEKQLARKPFPHALVVLSPAGEVRGVSLDEPAVHFNENATYLFLAFVGILYLVIGLFTIARERTPPALIFWGLCLASFAIYCSRRRARTISSGGLRG